MANKLNLTGIGDDELPPFTHCSLYLQPNYRVSCRGVGANSQNAGGIADLIDSVGHGSAAEGCDQTGHGGGMSEAGTVVNVVSAQYSPGKLLGDVVILVSAFG